MYHTNKLNQEKHFKKTLSTPRFSYKHLHIDHYHLSCTPTQQKIFNYIRQYQFSPWIKLRNEHIADAVGCSVITVIRATNKFHKDGFILKHQENRYTSNNYTLRIIVDHKNKRIFQSEYDRPIKKSSLLDNLFINLNPSSRLREGQRRIFKNINEKRKGKPMDNYNYRSFVVAKPKKKLEPKKHGIYAPWKSPQNNSAEQERIRLRHEIESCEKQLANPTKYFAFCLKESVKRTEKRLVECLEELIELERSSNEKQKLPYQHNTNIMESYCTAS